MEKEIENYLHLYLGCECNYDKTHYAGILTGIEGDSAITFDSVNGRTVWPINRMIPILRKLSDMTEEEMNDMERLSNGKYPAILTIQSKIFSCDEIIYLLSKHFDLFDLIPSDLAHDKNTL